MARVTISLPDEYVAAGKRVAAASGTTVSALTARALRNEILRREVADLIADKHPEQVDDTEWQELVDEAREEASKE